MKLAGIAWMAVVTSLVLASPAQAGWVLVPVDAPSTVAKSKLVVTTFGEWNRSTKRPSVKGEFWTQNGAAIDAISFFGGLVKGDPLVKERQKKDKPLPKFDPAMLPTDIPQLFEQTSRIVLGTSLFEITEVRPVTFLGHSGVQFSYRYTMETDNLERLGEARAAIVDGKLYMIEFTAPALHYFDAEIEDARKIMDSARL